LPNELNDNANRQELTAMNSTEPGRLLTAMVTPMRPDGAIDYAQARRLAIALLDSGSEGLVVSGTTGEAPTISIEEKVRLWGEVKDAVGDRGWVVAGSGDNCTADSLVYSREAVRAGADAVLLTAPYYNKPTQEGLLRHFATIAAGVDRPCIMYNIPGRTGVNMTADTQVRLSREGNILGVKESSANMAQIARIIEEAGPGFRVWSGNDEDTFGIMALGGYGVISVASHLVGRQLAALVSAMAEGETARAAGMHRRLLPLIDALFAVTNPIPVKYVLNQLGFACGPMRLPMCEPDEATGARIMAEVRRHAIDLPLPV
jgi:4-hydroxy-tetrahydrodipicolinate synthase